MSAPKFYTKAGRLTRYGLACGYVESFRLGAFSARLEMPAPSAGVIRVTENDDAMRIAYNGRSLVVARRAYDAAMRCALAVAKRDGVPA